MFIVKKIIYFRVQDHLRKMGLGRRALKELVDSNQIKSYCTKDVLEILEAPKKPDTIPLDPQKIGGFERMCTQLGLVTEK